MINKSIYHIILCLLTLASCTESDKYGYTEADRIQIRHIFQEYKNAVADSNGTVVADLVDSFTLDYYEYILQEAKTADSQAVEAKTLFVRYFVLLTRHMTTIEQLQSFTERDFLVFCVNNGFFKHDEQATMDSINVKGDEAVAYLFNNDGEYFMHLYFFKEHDQWKIDFGVFFQEKGDEIIKHLVSQTGENEHDALLLLLALVNNKMPDNSIWHPKVGAPADILKMNTLPIFSAASPKIISALADST